MVKNSRSNSPICGWGVTKMSLTATNTNEIQLDSGIPKACKFNFVLFLILILRYVQVVRYRKVIFQVQSLRSTYKFMSSSVNVIFNLGFT